MAKFNGACIYKITCNLNGKIYIGQTLHFRQRINEHCRHRLHSNMPIDYAIKKYGRESFTFEILCKVCNTLSISEVKSILNDLEIYFIKKYQSNTRHIGYNLSEGGGRLSVTRWTEERRKAHSQRITGSSNPCYRRGIMTGKFGKDNHLSKKIRVTNLITGAVTYYYGSHEASRKTGFTQATISNRCTKQLVDKFNNKWEYYD